MASSIDAGKIIRVVERAYISRLLSCFSLPCCRASSPPTADDGAERPSLGARAVVAGQPAADLGVDGDGGAERAQDADQLGGHPLQQQVVRGDGQPALGAGGGAERVGGAASLLLHPAAGEPVPLGAEWLEVGVE